MNKRILYVGDERSVFSLEDTLILSHDHSVPSVYVDLIAKNPTDLALAAIEILLHIGKVDATMTWTADLHTAYVVFLSKLFRKKSIVVVGGYEICNMPEIGYGMQTHKFRGSVVRWVLRNVDKVVVPSEAYRKKVKDLVGVDAAVIPNCSDIQLTPIKEKSSHVIMVAGQYGDANSFVALKGIQTYSDIAKAMPGTPFFLIGKADNEIKNKCTGIVYLGNKNHDEVINLLNRSKVYCQLSYTESFGVALLEAIQLGCIPVITDRDGMVEIVKDNGYKIKYGDVDAGVNAVKQALKDTFDRTEIISSERARYSREQRRLNFNKVIDEVLR